MRTVFAVLLLTLSVSAAQAGDVIKLSVFGKQMSPKADDFKNVNAKIGQLVAGFKLQSFEITALGIEGGFAACLKPNLISKATDLAAELKSVPVDESETDYIVEVRPTCE